MTVSTIPNIKAKIAGKIKKTLKNGDSIKQIKPITNDAIPINISPFINLLFANIIICTTIITNTNLLYYIIRQKTILKHKS